MFCINLHLILKDYNAFRIFSVYLLKQVGIENVPLGTIYVFNHCNKLACLCLCPFHCTVMLILFCLLWMKAMNDGCIYLQSYHLMLESLIIL